MGIRALALTLWGRRSRALAPGVSRARALTLVLLAALLPVAAAAQSAAAVNEDAFNRISDKLICQCGCNYGLRHCPHLQCPSAPVMRAAIREKLSAGLSDQQVIEAMVAQFGPAALAAPPAEGFNLSAWVMPFLVLLVGLWLAFAVIRKWRRRVPAQASKPEVVDHYRRQIERELKHLED